MTKSRLPNRVHRVWWLVRGSRVALATNSRAEFEVLAIAPEPSGQNRAPQTMATNSPTAASRRRLVRFIVTTGPCVASAYSWHDQCPPRFFTTLMSAVGCRCVGWPHRQHPDPEHQIGRNSPIAAPAVCSLRPLCPGRCFWMFMWTSSIAGFHANWPGYRSALMAFSCA